MEKELPEDYLEYLQEWAALPNPMAFADVTAGFGECGGAARHAKAGSQCRTPTHATRAPRRRHGV